MPLTPTKTSPGPIPAIIRNIKTDLTTSRADPNDALSLSEEPMYADGGGVFYSFIIHPTLDDAPEYNGCFVTDK